MPEPYYPRPRTTLPQEDKPSFLDNLPEFVQRGYNQSIAGMAQQLATGEQQFDLSDYDIPTLERIGAGVVSVLLDSPAFILGGGVGGIAGKAAAKQLVKEGSKQLIKSGVKRQIAEQVIQKGITQVGAFGVHSGITSGLSQQLESGEVDPVKVGGDILKGSALGALLGTTQGLTAKMSGATRLGAEISTFGIASPALEGRLPTKEDFVDATGILLGLKGVHGIAKVGKRAIKGEQIFQPREPYEKIKLSEDQLTDLGEATVFEKNKAQWQGRRFRNTEGEVVTRVDKFKDDSGLELIKYKDSKGKEYEVPVEDFYDKFDTGKLSSNIRSKRLAQTHLLEKENKIDADTKQQMLNQYGVKSSGDLAPHELFEYKERLRTKTKVKRFATFMEGQEFTVRRLPATGVIEDFVPKALRKYLVDPLKQYQDRTISKSGRVMNLKIGNFQNKFDNLAGTHIARFMDMKLPEPVQKKYGVKTVHDILKWHIKDPRGKNNQAIAEELSTMVRDTGEWKEFKVLMDDIYKEAKKVLPKIQPPQEKYLTQLIRSDILDFIMKDLAGFTKAVGLENIDKLMSKGKANLSPRVLESLKQSILESRKTWLPHKGGKSYTATLYEHLMKQGFDPVGAIQEMLSYNVGFLYKESGFLEKPRKTTLPKEFYENDIRKIAEKYILDTSRRIASAQEFGSQGKLAEALLKNVRLEGKGDIGIVEKIYRAATGLDAIDPANKYSPPVQRMFDNLMALNVAFKISTGFATIPNLTQPIISSVADLGIAPTLKGMYNLITNKGDIKAQIKKSGATQYNLIDELLGYAGRTGIAQKGARLMGTWSGFRHVNKLNQFIAASSAEVAVKSMYKRASGSKRLQAKLQRMGVDYTKPLEPQIPNAMRQFAVNSQLQKNVLRDVVMLSDSKVRPFMLFKSFGLRQYQFMKESMQFEISHGNFLPVIRLAALGYMGGMFVDRARHWLKEIYAGEDIYKEEKEGLDEFVDYIAQIGAFGVLGDILASENMFQSVKFFITPVIVSDAEKVSATLIKLYEDTGDYGLINAIRRTPKGLAPIAGTAGRSFMEMERLPLTQIPFSLQPKGQKEASKKSHRNFVLNKVKSDIYKGNSSVAIKNVNAWNRANPMYPITYDDINHKKMYEYILNKYTKKLNP